MKTTLLDATANATGDWTTVSQGGVYNVAVDGSADLGGGTLAVEFATPNGTEITQDTTNLSWTSAPEPVQVTIAEAWQVRAKLTGATSPDVTVFIHKAHAA